MKRAAILFIFALLVILLPPSLLAQDPAKAVTVPVTLDHNRIVIDVYVPLKDGTTKRVRGLVDTGDTEILVSLRVAQLLDKNASCAADWCSVAPPSPILIGGLPISLTSVRGATMPSRPAAFNDVLIPGMSPEIILPSSILKNYDIAIDYANRQLVIGTPGSVKFSGTAIPMKVDSKGWIWLTGKVQNQPCDFWLNTGSSATLLSPSLLNQWHRDHPDWPYAAGALGAANTVAEMNGNMKDDPTDLRREMLRVPAVELGTRTLHDVLVASNQSMEATSPSMANQTAMAELGGEAFKGTRIGIDSAHSTLYIEQINHAPRAAGLDVVGLTLRPEVDGRYTVVAVAPYEGRPSVAEVKAADVLVGVDGAPVTGATMGQVWSLLGGEPGKTRKLIIERDGKRMNIDAPVRRFLGEKKN